MTVAVLTLYEKLGGRPVIEVIIEEFYRRILADPTLAAFFINVDMDEHVRDQTRFAATALGGPEEYAGRSMNAVHEQLGVAKHHADQALGHHVQPLCP